MKMEMLYRIQVLQIVKNLNQQEELFLQVKAGIQMNYNHLVLLMMVIQKLLEEQ